MTRRAYEISPEVIHLIDVLALSKGVSKSVVIEEAVQHYAERCRWPDLTRRIEQLIEDFRRLPRY